MKRKTDRAGDDFRLDDDFELVDFSWEDEGPVPAKDATEEYEPEHEAEYEDGGYEEVAYEEDDYAEGDYEDGDYEEDGFVVEEAWEEEGAAYSKKELRAMKKQQKAARKATKRGLDAANGKQRRGFFYYAIPIVLISLIIISGYFFLSDFFEYKAASDEYKALERFIVVHKPKEVKEEEVVEEDTYPDLEIDFDGLLAVNPDFIGVLYIPALNDLTYPVVISHDNAEYINRTFEGNTNASGSIFMDCYASRDLTDANSLIYGHNMKNETMFGSLKTFATVQGFKAYAEHPFFYIYTKNHVYKYEIFSYHTTPVDSYIYDGFYGEDGYDTYVRLSEADFDVQLDSLGEERLHEYDFSERPRMVTLSTCWGTGHVYNFVIHGMLTNLFDV